MKRDNSSFISLRISQHEAWEGLIIIPAPAPGEPSIGYPGPKIGDIQLIETTGSDGQPVDQKALLSLGLEQKIDAEALRKAGGYLAKWIAKYRVGKAGVILGHLDDLGITNGVQAFFEGLLLGAFRFDTHKSNAKAEIPTEFHLLVPHPDRETIQAEIKHINAVAAGVNLARSLSHEPPNFLNPATLADRTQALAKAEGLKCQVLDDRALAELGAGAIVSVGQGSVSGSRLIILEHPGHGPRAEDPPVALVGKAITFDTGGYTIKTKRGMYPMKYDKDGGMAVIGVMLAAARLNLPIRIIGLIAAAENMVSAEAYRPSDIITSLVGKTIEIVSADAEGRMVMADALTYAERTFAPRALIDIATLTGGMTIALGKVRAGLFATDDDLAVDLVLAGERTHERLWRMPLDDDYFQLIKGDDSDLKNSSLSVQSTSIVAGMFLKEFVTEETPWAHLDIAGVHRVVETHPYSPKGYSGFGVRLLLDYLRSR